VVHVLPLQVSREMALVGASAPTALVILAERGLAKLLPVGIPRSSFGLSEREAEVAASIAHGLTVREAADRYEVSALTVRNQLFAAMLKLGVHRRAELVSLLTSLVPRLDVF
jgi:DNA-binding NarL/FixJ family response regulator